MSRVTTTTEAYDFDDWVHDEAAPASEPELSATVARSLALLLDVAGVSRERLLEVLPVIPPLVTLRSSDQSTGWAANDDECAGGACSDGECADGPEAYPEPASPLRERCGRVIRAAEAVQAFAAAVQLDAIGNLFADLTAVPPPMVVDAKNYTKRLEVWRGQCRDAVIKETAMLTGGMTTDSRSKVKVATTPGDRHATSREALRAGATTWTRVRTVATETEHLDPATAEQIAGRVLAPSRSKVLDPRAFTHEPTPDADAASPVAAGGSHDLLPVSHDGFRARLNRQITIADDNAETGERKRAERVASRETRVDMLDHGMGQFSATASAERVCAADQRLDLLARAARAAGDKRTLAQLRSDIATDLLIHGVVPGDKDLGAAPTARLEILVGLDTLIGGAVPAGVPGDDDWMPSGWQPREIGCGESAFGPIPASICRELLFTEGTVLRRLITDPSTGQVIDAASTYRVPASMAAVVQARDQHSRAPGVENRRTGTDFDHCTNWSREATEPAQGQTHPHNLRLLDRGHHNLKTHGFWSSTQAPDATVTWKTLTAVIDTKPFDPNQPTSDPAEFVDESIRAATQALEDKLGSDAVTKQQAALAFAALGGPVPATPPREFLAEQDQADQDEFNDTWARNLAAAESLRVRQQAADDQVSAQRDALDAAWQAEWDAAAARRRHAASAARADAERQIRAGWHTHCADPNCTDPNCAAALAKAIKEAGDAAVAALGPIDVPRPALPPYVYLDGDYSGPEWTDSRPIDDIEPPF